jgi:hypothetical protein
LAVVGNVFRKYCISVIPATDEFTDPPPDGHPTKISVKMRGKTFGDDDFWFR